MVRMVSIGSQSAHGGRNYRPEIDGLRALAVLPVVLFHAQFPGLGGGYVGVDVFFVISGFLITSILVAEISAGTYSVARFYERRARRIMPALIVVLLFVLATAPFSLLPSEFERLWTEALGALFFVANIVFWLDSGYFSSGSESKPLLHTWSLGIEEQFYIFAPIILAFVIRRFGGRLALVVAVGLIASFAGCVVLTQLEPSTTFYLLPTRAWELLAGSLLAIVMGRTDAPAWIQQRGVRNVLATLGLLCILAPVLFYSKTTSFPGYAAAAPVVGAVLIIGFSNGTAIGGMLSSRLLVFIGLISYSLYLWHWPLVVFFRNAGWLNAGAGRASVVLASILLAWLTWRCVEKPTRNNASFPTKRLLFLVFSGAFLVVLVAFCYKLKGTWESRFDKELVSYDAARYDISASRARCHISSGLRTPSQFCVLGHGDFRVVIWGDSHGVELANALSEKGFEVTSVTYSGCRPGVRDYKIMSKLACDRHNRLVFDYIRDNDSLDAVVLVANYQDDPSRLDDLVEVATKLNAAGRRVVIVGPTPTLSGRHDLPTHLARGGGRYAAYDDLDSDYFSRHAAGVADVVLPERLFCDSGMCNMSPDGNPILFDGHHPSMSAARTIADKLAVCLKSRRCSE